MTSEVNFDGLVGPTHHYGGLSEGNLASQLNKLAVSHPRAAALQGLEKMKLLLDLGVPQAILPPHERPHFDFLRGAGFTGSEREIIAQAAKARPDLLSIAYSASAMWAANAATVSPSADTLEVHDKCARGKVRLAVANLISTPHRKLEAAFTRETFDRIFGDVSRFHVWGPLPAEPLFADEGSANHMRLCSTHGKPGIEVSVYGFDDRFPTSSPQPKRFTSRQTFRASVSIPHDLRCWHFVQQHPDAIDAGAFHNDVVAVSNENVLFCHSQAWHGQVEFLDKMRREFTGFCHEELCLIEVPLKELTLEEAVSTYLFNSQIVTLPAAPPEPLSSVSSLPRPSTLDPRPAMLLLAPSECEHHPRARAVIERILAEDNPIRQVKYVDVRQSMRNGGGPACLRLRVVLTEEEQAALRGNVLLTPELYEQLRAWVTKHYREELTIADLPDPRLVTEVRDALDELTGILNLPNLYPFQL